MFGGSGTVLINTTAKKYIYNDINNYVAEIFDGLLNENVNDIVSNIKQIILQYGLSKTNKEGFEKLRDDYNNGDRRWIVLYTLMCHSFNHQFRFNNNHQYNSSFGKNRSYFSKRQEDDLYAMRNIVKSNVTVMSKSFENIDYSLFTENDLLYFDPPYYNSVGNYNDGKRGFEGWSKEHEIALLQLLDELNSKNVRFALSNNLKYDNPYICDWISKYTIHYLKGDYVNCNYQKINRDIDIEVLITNYEINGVE